MSLVRSNPDGEVGFLGEKRRLNGRSKASRKEGGLPFFFAYHSIYLLPLPNPFTSVFRVIGIPRAISVARGEEGGSERAKDLDANHACSRHDSS